MKLLYSLLVASTSLLHSVHSDGSASHTFDDPEHAWMSETDSTIVAYCVRPCDATEGAGIKELDPCGDGRGQTGFCSPVMLERPEVYGFAEEADSFLGCSHTVCEEACAGLFAEDATDAEETNITDSISRASANSGGRALMETLPTGILAPDGVTLCYPRTETMDGMYTSKDDAELSAVARGCTGSHSMGADMVMVGSTHMLCATSYSKEGMELGTFPVEKEANNAEEDGDHHDDGHDDHGHSHFGHAHDEQDHEMEGEGEVKESSTAGTNMVRAWNGALFAVLSWLVVAY